MRTEYIAAAESIRKWILEKEFTPGTTLPAGRLLAENFGCSRSIIERACVVLVTEGVVLRQGRKLKVRLAEQGRPKIEGVIYVLSYSEKFIQSAGRILTEEGVDHRLINLSWSMNPILEPVVRKILAAKPAGMIVSPGISYEEDTAKLLNEALTPVIACGNMGVSSKSSVVVDVYRGTEMAIRHLHRLGHRHIAHVSEVGGPEFKELAEHYRDVCLKFDMKRSGSTVWEVENAWHELLPDTLLAGRARNPEVTAIFGVARLYDYARGLFAVPEDLSVIGYGGSDHSSLTTVALRDFDVMSSWACLNLISQIRRAQSGLPPKSPTHAMLLPDLILRNSTRELQPQKVIIEKSGRPSSPKKDPAETWKNTYPFSKNNPSNNWIQLDLSKPANHSMKRQNGWLGAEPLLHFPPGLRSIHGVPFLVLDEDRNDGRAVITFRSPQAHSTAGEELPTKVKMPVNNMVKALYFLHGCGYVKPLAFAHYTIHYEKDSPISLPLVPLGGSRAFALKHLGSLKPNLQDWWQPTFEPEDFLHAHHVTVFNPMDPTAYARSLYTLEWINPRPKDKVASIVIEVDPKAGPTLALIAVTALL